MRPVSNVCGRESAFLGIRVSSSDGVETHANVGVPYPLPNLSYALLTRPEPPQIASEGGTLGTGGMSEGVSQAPA